MTFRGAANGNEAPIRVITGPKTLLGKTSKLSADPVNNELIAWSGGVLLFFDRLANGDVAPKRTLGGPNNRFSIANVEVDNLHNLLIVSGGEHDFDLRSDGVGRYQADPGHYRRARRG